MTPAPPTGTEATTTSSRTSPRPASPRRLLPGITIAVALIAAGIGSIVISGSRDKPRQAASIGRNIPVNDSARNAADLSANNSPTLVRNPADQANLVMANRIDSPTYSCGVSASFDGGGRWTPIAIPAPSANVGKCYAPDVAFAPNGTLYLSFVTLKGRANSPRVAWIATSTDGGKTLSRPIRAPLGKLAFQVRLAVDPQSSRRLYMTWLKASDVGLYKFTETGNPILAIRSEDGGRSWTDPVRVNDANRQRVVAPVPKVGPEGELYVLYLDLGDDRLDYEGGHRGLGGPAYDGTWKLVLARSTNHGGTWAESEVEKALVPTDRFIVFTPPLPALAVHKDRIYAAFQDGRDGDSDVRLWSRQGTGSWKAPVRVNDTARKDGTSQYLPQIAVAPDGRLDVVYYDRRGDRTDVLNEVSYQTSFNHGDSFTKHLRLSDQAFSSRIGFGSERKLPDLGSRLGLVSENRVAYAIWPDTRAGTRRSGKQDLARGIVGFTDPPRLANWLENLLRWGGIALILIGAGVLGLVLLGARRRA